MGANLNTADQHRYNAQVPDECNLENRKQLTKIASTYRIGQFQAHKLQRMARIGCTQDPSYNIMAQYESRIEDIYNLAEVEEYYEMKGRR